MKYFQIKWLTGLAVVAMSLAGCTKTNIDQSGNGGLVAGPDEALVTLKLNAPQALPATRTFSEDNVNFLDVLVFDKELKFVRREMAQFTSEGNHVYSFTVPLRISRDANDKFRIMVIANRRSKLNSFFPGPYLGGHIDKSYDQICAILVHHGADDLSEGLLMWGEFEDPIIVDEAHKNSYPAIPLIRPSARVDVGTNPDKNNMVDQDGVAIWEKLNNFSLEHLSIFKLKTGYSYAPSRANYDFTNRTVTKPTVPVGTTISERTSMTTETGGIRDEAVGIAVKGFYLWEDDVKMKASGAAFNDENHTNRPALVVGGHYEGSVDLSYYRIDFRDPDGADPDALYDLLRNHLYQIIITKVSGPGSPTAEEAYYGDTTSEIEAEIVEWNEAPVSTVLDGQYKLTLTRDKIAVGSEGSIPGANILTGITTTFTSAGLTIDQLKDVATGITPSWLTFSANGTNASASRTVTIRNIGATATARTAQYRAKSGNMEYIFKIEQSAGKWLTATAQNPYTLDGSVYSLDVSAICDFHVAIKAGTNNNGVMKALITTSGGKNTSKIYFKAHDGRESGAYEGTATLVFTDAQGINPAKEVNIVFTVSIARRFAKGNIVAHPGNSPGTPRLMFAEHANAQGMFFRWGSLVGISGSAQANNSIEFSPDRVAFVPALYGGGNITVLTDIPYTHNTPMPNMTMYIDRLILYYPDNGTEKGFREADGVGDICRYMTARGWTPAGKWRMPTVGEFKKLFEESSIGNVPSQKGYRVGATPWGYDVLASADPNYIQAMQTGWFLGIGVTSSWIPLAAHIEDPPLGTVFLPASGSRVQESPIYNGQLINIGTSGTYWSSSSFSTNDNAGAFAFFGIGTFHYIANSYLTEQFPVRCFRYEY